MMLARTIHNLCQAANRLLVLDHQNGTNIDEEDEFLNDNELFFMQNLNRNEALLEYYHYIQEGLCSLFI